MALSDSNAADVMCRKAFQMSVPLPLNEQERLRELSEYSILDTAPEKAFDDIVCLAAQICGCPIAAVTLIDRDRQWFKSILGVEVAETPRAVSFCTHAILGRGLMHVTDAALDARFRDNPLVTGDPHVRFYAGAPLVTAGGAAIGALCVLDRFPRDLSPEQRQALEHLSRIVMAQLDLRKLAAEQRRALAQQADLTGVLQEREHQLRTLTDNVPACIARVDAGRRYAFANRAYQDRLGIPLPQVIGRTMAEVLGGTAYETVRPYVDRVLAGETVEYVADLDYRTIGRRTVHTSYVPERGPQGEVTGFVLSATDVTERRREARARAEAEARLATTVANLPVVIWAVDADGVFTFSDGLALARIGLRPGEAVGSSLPEMYADRPDLLAYVREAFAGERVGWTAESRGVVFETHITLLRDDAGRVTGLLGVSQDVTERRRAEEALRANEAKYRRLAEAGLIGVVSWRQDGTLLSVNDRFLATTGYTRADFEAGRMRWDDMTPSEWRATCDEAVRRLVETGIMGPLEKEFFRKDGSRVPVLMGAARLEDGTGGVSFVLDLTERKQAEAALDRERERFRALAEGLGAGLLMTDLDDTILYANPRMAEITGYSTDEMTGRTALDLLLAPAQHEAMRRRNQDRAQGIGGVYEIELLYRDGGPRWLEVHAVPFRDEAGRVVGTLATSIDITDRVRAQGALLESERRGRLALSGGRLGWWDLDLSTGLYGEFSDQCKAHFGLPPDAPVRFRDFLDRVHPDDRDRVAAECRQAIQQRQVYEAEYRVVWPDGSVHWLSAHGAPVQDEALRMAGVTQEVTERRRAEDALRERTEALRARTELLESVLAAIPHQVFWKDRHSVYLGCNANFARAAGLADLADIAGRTDADLAWTPGEAEAYRRDDRWVIESGAGLLDREETSRHADGTAAVGLTSKLPLHDSEGRTIGLLGVSQDITERKSLEAERERLLADMEALLAEATERADQDPLTGLLNHRAFHRRLQEEADRAQRAGTPLAVVMLDMDNFKFFNDAYGHLAGDDVLRRVAGVLRGSCRSYDTVARFGGDEFAVLMPGLGAADAARLTRLSLERLRAQGYVPPGGDAPVPLGLSAGVAVFPTEAPSRLDVLALADERLRLAKSGGDEAVAAALDVRTEMSRRVGGFSMLDALVAAVDNKDRYTRRHSEGVLAYSLEIARELGLDEKTQRIVAVASLLHDVGKIGVPDAVLRKPGKLTGDESEAMKQHPMMGAVMVGAVPGFEDTLDAVRHHHERWDGNGYPFGLRGEETPLLARLLAVADAFSAMTTDRPYRKALPEPQALAILAEGAGTQWDPQCVRAFLQARSADPRAHPVNPRSV